ncbi:hypothetical protein EJ04DRAFT_538679 [Polyplosphaeria fusca]|uniref:AB hydrolase-1 domain-containing protein n=1 Tax=Polyplosphaeria fusca TaxID=682080 RepID=A0A9P4QK42_9PLEO|nr:hypothetical protein EJ04DRAFT_538679 [Polyplosphaeria fusca]
MGALEFLCDARFHRSFLLRPNEAAGRSKPLRVSYADYGDRHSDAVVLVCGALMATRFTYATLDGLAKAFNVRIIHPNRPGIGGSDQVDLHQRIATWLEMVPQLLSHLGVSHIAVASHSGGVIYALNTILTYPQLLHPVTPYATFFAPWVHHSHSGVPHLRATELLPATIVGRFAALVRFLNSNVAPIAGLSTGLVHGIKESLHHTIPDPAPLPVTPPNTMSRTASIASSCQRALLDIEDPKVVEELRRLIVEYLFAEGIDGISDDAKLFLRKPTSLPWCSTKAVWSDFDDAVPLLSKMTKEGDDSALGARKWRVDAFHAETDHMVGEKGREWFDNCWKLSHSTANSPGADTEDQGMGWESLEYKSHVVPASGHDYVMDPAFGAAERWLESVREAFPSPAEV